MKTFHVGGINPLRRYKTLDAALKEAKDDDTIELHKNVVFSGGINRNIILNGNGHTLTVEKGKVGLDCSAPIVIRDLTFLCDSRSNGAILQRGGRLERVTVKTKGPARVLFPMILHKGGKLSLTDCTVRKLVSEEEGTLIAGNCTFTDYYGGIVHIPNHENLSVFRGSTQFQNCNLNCCWFKGETQIRNCILGVFNSMTGNVVITDSHLEPTVNEPAVNLKKEPSDGPLEQKNETSKFSLEQSDGTLIVHHYTSSIPEEFVGFHVIKGAIEIHDSDNADANGYHIVRQASLSFVDTKDAAYWDTMGTTLSTVRSQVNTAGKTETAMDRLDKLIGLKSVKETVKTILNTITANQKTGNKDFGFSYHMVFAGDPGTGKTTVAKIVAQALFEIGAIPENKCTEVSVDSLVKGYVGQTASHVREVLDKAVGGVVFIDEAYELTVKDGQNSFNSEVLSVLIRYMEEHRDDMVVIAAGYTKEMKAFLASNIGLPRRFQWVAFEDYTPKEMAAIFEQMRASYGEEYDRDELKTLIPQFFDKLTGLYLKKPDSKGRVTNGGNGGLVRNAFQQVVQARNNRIAEETGATTKLTQTDLAAGFRKEMEKAIRI